MVFVVYMQRLEAICQKTPKNNSPKGKPKEMLPYERLRRETMDSAYIISCCSCGDVCFLFYRCGETFADRDAHGCGNDRGRTDRRSCDCVCFFYRCGAGGRSHSCVGRCEDECCGICRPMGRSVKGFATLKESKKNLKGVSHKYELMLMLTDVVTYVLICVMVVGT